MSTHPVDVRYSEHTVCLLVVCSLGMSSNLLEALRQVDARLRIVRWEVDVREDELVLFWDVWQSGGWHARGRRWWKHIGIGWLG